MTRARGTGSLYKRGKVWWLKYFVDGRPVRESSHSESQEEATRLLKKRLGQTVEGKRFSPRADRVRLSELLTDWLSDLKIRGATSLPQAKIRAMHLRSFFGERRAHTLTTSRPRPTFERLRT